MTEDYSAIKITHVQMLKCLVKTITAINYFKNSNLPSITKMNSLTLKSKQ